MSAATAREFNARRLLADLPGAELVEAVDGRDPRQVGGVAVYPGNLFRPGYPFGMTAPEIGVFQSHRRCWQRLVDSGEDFALIAEDDLAVDPGRLKRALAMIAEHAGPDWYVRLPVKDREAGPALAERDGLRLIRPRVVGLQCICQVVGRGAAARLLAATVDIDRPVDTLIQMHWATGQKVHALTGSGNREVAGQIGGSTIQVKVREGKLKRELQRAWYRAQVALRPQR